MYTYAVFGWNGRLRGGHSSVLVKYNETVCTFKFLEPFSCEPRRAWLLPVLIIRMQPYTMGM
jgi:hypothetical protein